MAVPVIGGGKCTVLYTLLKGGLCRGLYRGLLCALLRGILGVQTVAQFTFKVSCSVTRVARICELYSKLLVSPQQPLEYFPI